MQLQLTDLQESVLEIIKEKRQFGIFLDMGVGKTVLILSLIDYLVFDKLDISSVLIIGPATVANELQVWQDEIQKWDNFKYFDYQDLSGSKKKRIEKLKNNSNSITIMSDALIDWWYETYGNLDMFDMIVIDESSRFKSQKSVKFKRLQKMINLDKHRVYELSGTPTPNGWNDIWSQIFLLDKGERLGRSYYKFIDSYFTTFGYKLYLSKQNKALIEQQIQDICVFAGSESIKLPPKEEKIIWFKFDKEKQQKYDDFEKSYILDLDFKDLTVLSKQNLINKCLQLSNGCIYHDKHQNYTVFDDQKLEYVRKYSEEHPEENILVFYAFKFDKARLMTLPGAEEIIDTASKNKWNEKKIKIGVISPYSFQYGGNLQFGGYTIIWFGLMWGLENYLQSNKRVWRNGQKHAVKILYLMTVNTYDDYVYKTLVLKEADQKDLLDRIDIRRKEIRDGLRQT